MNVAFIPVRGGSKSIPLKNIKIINGKPLVYWTVKAACDCKYIDKIFVATDSDRIREVITSFKQGKEGETFSRVEVIGRSEESATDTASTECAMLEFTAKYCFENIVLIQATSPLLLGKDLEKGFETFEQADTDSVLSVVRQKRFHWRTDSHGIANPTNYDVYNRPRRQEFDGYLVENGAFYITSRRALIDSKNRISGRIKAVEMHEDTFFEIDEPSDWIIIEALMKKNNISCSNKKSKIKMFLTDCDGCLTDGGMYYSENGDELKKFNTRDGIAFSLLKDRGILIGIITGEAVELNKRRAEKLKMDIYEAGCNNKLERILQLCQLYNIDLTEVLYVGDELNDLEIIKKVGFSCCPSDAHRSIKEIVNYVSNVPGGSGVIRDIFDNIFGGE